MRRKWIRLSLQDFKFTKISKVYLGPDWGGGRDSILDPWFDYRIQADLSLYTNGEGLYRLRKYGELLCEGDEFLLACTVAGLENEVYKELDNNHGRAFVIDGEWP